MTIQEIYKKLKNVKIVDIAEQHQSSFFSYFFKDDEKDNEEDDEKDDEKDDINNNWVAIFHKKYEKYLVTNNISIFGLNENVKNIEVVGFANDLNYMMFVIFEHQKARGLEITIEDEIKELVMKEIKRKAKEEWYWANPNEAGIYTFKN